MTVIGTRWKRLLELTSRQNTEPEAVRVVLATPVALLEPVVSALAFPLDYFSDVEREDLLLG